MSEMIQRQLEDLYEAENDVRRKITRLEASDLDMHSPGEYKKRMDALKNDLKIIRDEQFELMAMGDDESHGFSGNPDLPAIQGF